MWAYNYMLIVIRYYVLAKVPRLRGVFCVFPAATLKSGWKHWDLGGMGATVRSIKMSTFSIIIPVFNESRYIQQVLEAVDGIDVSPLSTASRFPALRASGSRVRFPLRMTLLIPDI